MCRWVAYSGSPIRLEDLLYKPEHSLIDQSLHARLGVETTNGDGFGIAWYGEEPFPAVYKGVDPAWNDRNLRELSRHVQSRLIFAHIRASTGSPVQQSNCHPFRHGRWLWMHNGQIAHFQEIKRELVLAIHPSLYSDLEGSTDTEVFFFLALTFGMEEDPPAAVERSVGFIESVARSHGIEKPVRMSVALSDGDAVWAFRYSTEDEPPSLYFSTKIETLREMYPDVDAFQSLAPESRLVVSEPLGSRVGAWNEVPRSHYGIVHDGQDVLRPFTPRA